MLICPVWGWNSNLGILSLHYYLWCSTILQSSNTNIILPCLETKSSARNGTLLKKTNWEEFNEDSYRNIGRVKKPESDIETTGN